MLRLKTVVSTMLLIACLNTPPTRGSQETAPQSRDETPSGLDQVVRRIVAREDEYLLGRIDWRKGLKTKSLIRDSWKASAIFGTLSNPFPFQSDQILDVFAGMILVDKAGFDEKRYQFRYIRREFLGEMRCLVFELRPERKVRDSFSGRIWVEDKDFTIVRFNGVNAMREDLHFDS